MLHAFAADKSLQQSSAPWIHSAKDKDHRPFANEVAWLQSKVLASDENKSMKSIVTYTREESSILLDDDNENTGNHDSSRTIYHTGRLKEPLLKDHITPALLATKNAHASLCGTTNFAMDMEGIWAWMLPRSSMNLSNVLVYFIFN